MGKKNASLKPGDLSAKTIEYVSQRSSKDVNDADLRRIEVITILEEIFRLGGRRNQKRAEQMEDNQDAA